MSVDEIATELTIAVIEKSGPISVAGRGVSAEALGKKFGQLYRGILIEVVDALKIVGEIRMVDEDWDRMKQELEEWKREQKEK